MPKNEELPDGYFDIVWASGQYLTENLPNDYDQWSSKKLDDFISKNRPVDHIQSTIEATKKMFQSEFFRHDRNKLIDFSAIKQLNFEKPTKFYFNMERKMRDDNNRSIESMTDSSGTTHKNTSDMKAHNYLLSKCTSLKTPPI